MPQSSFDFNHFPVNPREVEHRKNPAFYILQARHIDLRREYPSERCSEQQEFGNI